MRPAGGLLASDGRFVVAPGVEALCSILRPIYRVPERPWKHAIHGNLDGWDTVVVRSGISTEVLADQFRAGDSIVDVARWMAVSVAAVEAAIRWEALSRRVRLARVRRAVLGPA